MINQTFRYPLLRLSSVRDIIFMMYKSTLTLLALVASSTAWTVPVEYVEERHIVQINKRQADVSQLLQL